MPSFVKHGGGGGGGGGATVGAAAVAAPQTNGDSVENRHRTAIVTRTAWGASSSAPQATKFWIS